MYAYFGPYLAFLGQHSIYQVKYLYNMLVFRAYDIGMYLIAILTRYLISTLF